VYPLYQLGEGRRSKEYNWSNRIRTLELAVSLTIPGNSN